MSVEMLHVLVNYIHHLYPDFLETCEESIPPEQGVPTSFTTVVYVISIEILNYI